MQSVLFSAWFANSVLFNALYRMQCLQAGDRRRARPSGAAGAVRACYVPVVQLRQCVRVMFPGVAPNVCVPGRSYIM